MDNVLPENKENAAILMLNFLLKEFKKRRWWLVQIAPEIENSSSSKKLLKSIGLNQLKHHPYSSGLIDLSFEEEDLLKRLKKKWRYYLIKGQKLDFRITVEHGYNSKVPILIESYKELQEKNSFTGVSEKLILVIII